MIVRYIVIAVLIVPFLLIISCKYENEHTVNGRTISASQAENISKSSGHSSEEKEFTFAFIHSITQNTISIEASPASSIEKEKQEAEWKILMDLRNMTPKNFTGEYVIKVEPERLRGIVTNTLFLVNGRKFAFVYKGYWEWETEEIFEIRPDITIWEPYTISRGTGGC